MTEEKEMETMAEESVPVENEAGVGETEANNDTLQTDAPDSKTADAAEEDTTEEHPKKEKKAEKKLRAELETIRKQCAEAEARAAEMQDRYTRLAAEYDNFRKRSQKEKESIYGDAIEDALKGLLPVIDNLQYASKYGNADPGAFAEGVRLILDKLPENLSKLNVTAFGAPGDTFDPNLHNAVMHEENDAYGEGEIVDVLQCGYLYGEKVIRYAMVKVAN